MVELNNTFRVRPGLVTEANGSRSTMDCPVVGIVPGGMLARLTSGVIECKGPLTPMFLYGLHLLSVEEMEPVAVSFDSRESLFSIFLLQQDLGLSQWSAPMTYISFKALANKYPEFISTIGNTDFIARYNPDRCLVERYEGTKVPFLLHLKGAQVDD